MRFAAAPASAGSSSRFGRARDGPGAAHDRRRRADRRGQHRRVGPAERDGREDGGDAGRQDERHRALHRRVPGGVSSRTLRFAYRTHLGEETPAATASLTLRVRAGIGLHVSPA